MMFQPELEQLLGFSADELRFLEAARHGGAAERAALQHAMLTFKENLTVPTLSTSEDDDPAGPVDISYLRLLLSVLPLTLLAAVSGLLRLGLHNKLAIATIRCFGQLSVLGYILVPIFVANRWWLTLLYTLFMLIVAAVESVSRPAQAYDGMLFEVLVAMGVSCALSISFGLSVIVQVSPWYDPQYLIPMLGMLLGNSCSSIAVGLSAALEDLSAGRDKVEAMLVLGATRVEATRDVVVRAARLALTPLLNSMNVVGIVSIPGMMTGQILGGSDPLVAARYQIMIFFLVAIASGASALVTIYAAVLTLCDTKHRLRSEKLQSRVSKTSGAVTWITEQLKQGWAAAKTSARALRRRWSWAVRGQPAARSRHRFSSYLHAGNAGGEEGRGNDVEQPLIATSPRD